MNVLWRAIHDVVLSLPMIPSQMDDVAIQLRVSVEHETGKRE
jgi:hypothetical protein